MVSYASGLMVLRVISSIYALIVLIISFKELNDKDYGMLALSLTIYALGARLISYGFDYKSRQIVQNQSYSHLNAIAAKLYLFLILSIVFYMIMPDKFYFYSILAAFVYSFDISPFFQAKRSVVGIGRLSIGVFGFLGVLLLATFLIYPNMTISAEMFFILTTMPQGILWILYIIKRKNDLGVFNGKNSIEIIKKSTSMALINQIPLGYANLIPILIASQSIQAVGIYYFFMRIANLGKMIGVLINQSYFYSLAGCKKNEIYLNALIVGAGVFIAGIFVAYIFPEKLTAVDNEYLIIAMISILSGNSIIANHWVIEVFFKNSRYWVYFWNTLLLITICVGYYYFNNKYNIENSLATHFLIELLLMLSAIIYKNFNKARCKDETR